MATEQRARIISNIQRYAALFGAAIIGFGFIPIPLTDPSLPKATWLEWFIAILPLMPFTILALSIVSRRKIPIFIASVLAFVFFGAGAFATIMLAAFSGGGSEMVLLHGTALTMACGTSILLASAHGQKAKSVAFGVYTLPVLVGFWSLAMMPIAYSNAVEISSGRAFCIGEHSPSKNELRSIVGLRGCLSTRPDQVTKLQVPGTSTVCFSLKRMILEECSTGHRETCNFTQSSGLVCSLKVRLQHVSLVKSSSRTSTYSSALGNLSSHWRNRREVSKVRTAVNRPILTNELFLIWQVDLAFPVGNAVGQLQEL